MKPDLEMVQKWFPLSFSRVPYHKGSSYIFLRGHGFYVWKDTRYLYLQGQYFWNRVYKFPLSELVKKPPAAQPLYPDFLNDSAAPDDGSSL